MLEELKKKIEDHGLTTDQYEQCLADAYMKCNRTIDLDWQEIIDKYGLDMHYDTLRKATQTIFGGAFVSEYYKAKQSADGEDVYLQKIRSEKQALYKEKQKLFDERNALRKQLRDQARNESLAQIYKNAIRNHQWCQFNYVPNDCYLSENDLIIHLTDIHCGINVATPFNTFNSEILKKRLFKYLDAIREIRDTYEAENAYVILGGDMIQGIIHLSARIDAKENTAEQIMIVSDLITNFIYELSTIFKYVEVHSTAGNHARATANKDECAHGENLDLLIPYTCKLALQHIHNVSFKENYLDYDIATFEVRGHRVYATHGDKDNAKNVVYHMTQFARKAGLPLPDLIYLGHRHTNGLSTVDDVKVIETGCVVGMDNYAVEQRLVGTPEQTVTVVSENCRIKALCDIQID